MSLSCCVFTVSPIPTAKINALSLIKAYLRMNLETSFDQGSMDGRAELAIRSRDT